MTGVYFFLLSIAILFLLSATGKVGMGFQIPVIVRPLPWKYKEILKNNFNYYKQLSRKDKTKFEHKVQRFIHIKEFIPRQFDRVTDEMKVLISACAVQLTFGFPNVFLSHFKRILVYPDDYYSTINKTYHKGEVNPRVQAIVISWKNFVAGYDDLKDGRNLGLHELAHALRLEDRIFNEEFKFFDHETLDLWHQLANQEIERIQKGESRMFRDYAGTNQEEFFSVAIENFFERPDQFKELMPRLYANLVLLLKQDPSAITNHA